MRTPPQSPKGNRPQVFDDPAVDQLYAAYVTLCTELAVAFDKIDTLETALERNLGVSREQIEQIALTQSLSAERTARRNELAARLLRPFKDFRESHIAASSAAETTPP